MIITGRKKISRRKPGDTSPRKNYFDENTQAAIVKFQLEEQQSGRDTIYTQEISPAFNTLVENLINVYKFQVVHETKEDLRNECVEFLFTVIRKYDPTRASKAFSYFNVVAKNWLTIRSKQNARAIQSFISIDNKETFSTHELEIIENYRVIPSCDEVVTHDEFKNNFKDLLGLLKEQTKTDNESVCVEAITVLLESVEDIDLINKRAVMAYMREITKLSSKQLSVVLSGLKKSYREIRKTSGIEL